MKVITIQEDEPFLRKKSEPVDFHRDNIDEYIKILHEYAKETSNLLALALNQLGILKRVVYLKNTKLNMDEEGYDEQRVLINPRIIKQEGLTDYWEACASCLDNCGHVYRPYKIVVEYYGKDRQKRTESFENFEATVLCHEIDHLDGILHIDRSIEILIMNADERKQFRETHPYHITSKTGDYEKLLKEVKR